MATDVQVKALSTEIAAFPELPTAKYLPAPSEVIEFTLEVSKVEKAIVVPNEEIVELKKN